MFMAHCSSSAEDIHRADANIKGITPTVFVCSYCHVIWAKLGTLIFIPCHRKYSQSECRKAVGYSTILHPTFPSYAAHMSH